jgi:F-type H+-transporting ATPase subunit b
MQTVTFFAAQEGGIVDGLSQTAKEIGLKFGFDTQLFFSQLIGFFIVAYLLNRFAIRPLQAMLDERQKKIADSLAAAERMKEDLAKAEQERQRVLAEAGAHANRIVEEARTAAGRMTELETQKALTAAQEILEKARQAGEADVARMREELRKEVGRLVVQTTARVTGKVLTPEDHQRLAEETRRELSVSA